MIEGGGLRLWASHPDADVIVDGVDPGLAWLVSFGIKAAGVDASFATEPVRIPRQELGAGATKTPRSVAERLLDQNLTTRRFPQILSPAWKT